LDNSLTKKYIFKYIKISEIGALLRSFFCPAKGALIRILIYFQMEPDYPLGMLSYGVLAFFNQGIHLKYLMDSSTYHVGEFIIRGI